MVHPVNAQATLAQQPPGMAWREKSFGQRVKFGAPGGKCVPPGPRTSFLGDPRRPMQPLIIRKGPFSSCPLGSSAKTFLSIGLRQPWPMGRKGQCCGRTKTTARPREARRPKTPHFHALNISTSGSIHHPSSTPPSCPGSRSANVDGSARPCRMASRIIGACPN